MKTLKKQSTDTSGKVCTEFACVKDVDIKAKVNDGWKFCNKVEWKVATKGYGKKVEKKAVKAEVTSVVDKKPYSKPRRS